MNLTGYAALIGGYGKAQTTNHKPQTTNHSDSLS